MKMSIQIKEGTTISFSGDQHLKTVQSPASPHQLATMTNVNVLDLHRDYGDSTKVYDKGTNTVYIYSHNHKTVNINQGQGSMIESLPSTSLALSSHSSESMERLSSVTNNITSHENHVSHTIDGRISTPIDLANSNVSRSIDVPVTRLVDDQFIQRLVENQEVVSREFVNGEHHIITRNENGEHILTRIVQNTDKLLTISDHGYEGMPPPAPPILGEKHNSLMSSESNNLKQVVYTHGDKGEIIYADTKSGEVYTAINSEESAKNNVEMIYTEDGNKTVIYTTAGSGTEQKTAELYQTGDLGVIGENQVIIQGGLQYTAQPGPNGTTVYVLSDDGNEIIR